MTTEEILKRGKEIAIIVQNTTFTTNFVPIEKFDGWSVSLGDVQKNLLDRVAGDSAGQMQSYPSKWDRHYHCKDCAKDHFHN